MNDKLAKKVEKAKRLRTTTFVLFKEKSNGAILAANLTSRR